MQKSQVMTEMSGGVEENVKQVVNSQTLARIASVEDDAVTTRSNSDDEHQNEEQKVRGQ